MKYILFKVPSEHSRSRTSSGVSSTASSGSEQRSRIKTSNSDHSLCNSGHVTPAILITDSTQVPEQKPVIRKPLGPPVRKSRSLDHGVRSFNSGSFLESSGSTLPASTVPIPAEFDPTEYEFLTRTNTDENDANNNDELDLGLGASAVSNSASNSSLVSLFD